MEELKMIIEDQRKGHENEPMWMVGQQLLDIAAHEPAAVEILKQDLSVSGMGLKDAAGALKAYADKNRGGKREYCITPNVADKILRDFYKLPEMELEVRQQTPEQFREEVAASPSFGLDLADFL